MEIEEDRLLRRLSLEESLEDASELAIELESVSAGTCNGCPMCFQDGEGGAILGSSSSMSMSMSGAWKPASSVPRGMDEMKGLLEDATMGELAAN